jgi:hypothetical protein
METISAGVASNLTAIVDIICVTAAEVDNRIRLAKEHPG